MADKENSEWSHDRDKSIQVFIEAAEIISAGGKEILKSTETIMKSCLTPGTVGEAHKSQLLDKVEELKKLAELHNSVSNRLEGAARKLANGIPEEEVMSEMMAYNTFFADQLESEKTNSEGILNMLKNDGSKGNSD